MADKIISSIRTPVWKHQFMNIFCKHVVILSASASGELQEGCHVVDKVISFAGTPVYKHHFMKIFFRDSGALSASYGL